MTSTSTAAAGTTTAPSRSYRPSTAIPVSAAVVAVLGSAVNALLALLGVALGLDAALPGLQPVAYIVLTVVAAIGGAIGWHIVNRRSSRPAGVMRWLVPTFLVISFVPDILLGAGMGTAEGWLYCAVLMLMHVATITIAVLAYRRWMPLRMDAAARSPR